MHLSIPIAADEAAFFKKAAHLILETASQAVAKNGRFTWAIPGGGTPQKLYRMLAEPYYRDRLPWSQTYIFFGDERCLPPDHPDSNYKMVRENMLSKIPLPPDHIFRIKGEMSSSQEAAKAYEQELRSFFKVDKSIPVFDLILLGVGEDGHTASLFPGTETAKEKIKWVVGTETTHGPAKRVSLTLPVLNAARKVLFLVMGASKASIVREVLREDDVGARFPSEMVRPVNGELIWLLDKGAASKLPREVALKGENV